MLIDTEGTGCGLGGERIKLDSSKPALWPCKWCGSEWGVLTGPKGPHHDGVRCFSCGRHLGWLPPPHEEISLIED